MRCLSPPLKACGNRRMYSGRSPTSRMSSATRSARLLLDLMPWTKRGSPTMSNRVILGLSEEKGSWKIICISLRRERSSPPGRDAMSTVRSSLVWKMISPSVTS